MDELGEHLPNGIDTSPLSGVPIKGLVFSLPHIALRILSPFRQMAKTRGKSLGLVSCLHDPYKNRAQPCVRIGVRLAAPVIAMCARQAVRLILFGCHLSPPFLLIT